MSKRMLIDASHPEESRVAILNNDRLEEFDFETTTKKQLKGNIYLAKVIRIEPSLQAAFVDFGGSKHGFLAFNEIHPDYYRIPVEDREALMIQKDEEVPLSIEEVSEEEAFPNEVETLGGEDVEEIQEFPKRPRSIRQYKIQEVIKRRQIMLVRIVKEERGGKGAALTTYLSLAGRYCVLMPNAAKGGGISRKITNAADRKRLREVIESIQLPESASIIIRTAGMARSKIEIKRDCDYLMRLWNDIREKTLHSIAPCLIYEESDLIKRAIRDYYTRDIDEVWIEGEEGYKEAKEFIRKLMPSHAKKLKQYTDEKLPLFHRYGVERQIDTMHNPIIHLKSGGYIVFGTTEALVAIDVNSGKATRERHIEETAFKTNLEAAEEIARQLRLRDLAGLVVIDFIDMDESRNVDAVERRLKDAMRHDRARVQVGRISPFGLLELSRQRLRPNIIESTSLPCPSCRGTGMVRSVESSSLHVLRAIEEEAIEKKVSELNVFVPSAIALYILNHKRKVLQDLETRWQISIRFSRDDTLIPPDYRIERIRMRQESALEKTTPLFTDEKTKTTSIEPAPQPSSQGKHQQRSRRDRFKEGGGGRSHQLPYKSQEISSSGALHEGKEGIPAEAHIPGSEEEIPRGKGRRRYRKFDRRAHRKQGEINETEILNQPAAFSETSVAVPLEQKKASVLPQKEIAKAKTENNEQKKTEKQFNTPEKKTVPSRKGWWQRLLE